LPVRSDAFTIAKAGANIISIIYFSSSFKDKFAFSGKCPSFGTEPNMGKAVKIILLGYMGRGKSTVGRQLAQKLSLPFIDLDAYIEEQFGSSIPEIFEQKGEIVFRRKEHEYLKEILGQSGDAVIALGGGTPCYSDNMELILGHTQNVFYLRLGIASLAKRLQTEKNQRPLIAHLPDLELPEFIGKHLFERAPFYNKAPHTLQADKMDEDALLATIESKLI
jgi:shikimate kinase